MASFILERNLVDHLIIDDEPYERRIIFKFDNPPSFVIKWYNYQRGKHEVKESKNPTLYAKLEQIYREKRDRCHGYEPK